MSVQYRGDEVQIGGGFGGMKPLAQHGTVIIDDGVLTLLGTQGQIIASGPLDKVEVKRIPLTGGQSVSVIIDGAKYTVSIGYGAGAVGVLHVGAFLDTQADTDGFIDAFTALSGKTVR